jgi:hypothetical protein
VRARASARVENRPVTREQRRPRNYLGVGGEGEGGGILTAGGVMSGNSRLNVAEIRLAKIKLALNGLDITQMSALRQS